MAAAGVIWRVEVVAEKSVNSEAGIWRTLNCGVSARAGKENRLAVALESVLLASAVTVMVSTTAANPRNGSSGALRARKLLWVWVAKIWGPWAWAWRSRL